MKHAPVLPLRVYAIRDGEDDPSWGITTNDRLFTRTSGLKESVLIDELTWVGHGLADQGLFRLFKSRVLYSTHPPK